jgi:hypothetical protein
MFPKEIAELVPWVVFLLPGWLSLVVANLVTDIPSGDELHAILASFMFSALSYALARAVWIRTIKLRSKLTCKKSEAHADPPVVAAGVKIVPPTWTVFAAAGFLGLVFGGLMESNIPYAGLRFIPFGLGGEKIAAGRPRRLTLKDAKANMLTYYLAGEKIEPAYRKGDNEGNYFRITMDGGLKYEGIIIRSESSDLETDIYLNPACAVSGTDVTPIMGPGVIIYEKSVRAIEIVDRAHSTCYSKTEMSDGYYLR